MTDRPSHRPRHRTGGPLLVVLVLAVALHLPGADGSEASARSPSDGRTAPAVAARDSVGMARPDVLLITVDTLRADRLGSYGYPRNTTPAIDALLARGVRFTTARTVEPLTQPACATLLTGQPPHVHGATRNGLRIHEGTTTLAGRLARAGFATMAAVSNWTLRAHLSGLDAEFDQYDEVLTRARWFGMIRREARAADVTDVAIERWRSSAGQPRFLWAHFVEPHAPYLDQEAYRERLGYEKRGRLDRRARYDTEVAAVDAEVGRLVEALEADSSSLLIVFTADHGENLGEHGVWGHGRHLWEEQLRVPLGFVWAGRLSPRVLDGPATLLDVAPTVLSLIDVGAESLTGASDASGVDWSGALRGGVVPAPPPTFVSAHRGAVMGAPESERARRRGLIATARIDGSTKEVYDLRRGRRAVFDLLEDPQETRSLAPPRSNLDETLRAWTHWVVRSIEDENTEPETLSGEDEAALRSLGYID